MFLITLVFLLILQTSAEMHVSDFSAGIFKTSQPKGFWPVFTGTYDSSGQILIAYSDFNGDKYIDMVTLDNLSKAATIYIWNPKMSIYIPTLLNGTGSPIISVIPSDYDLDGSMDILIVNEVNDTYEIHMQLMDTVEDYKCTLKDHPLDSNLFTGLDKVEPFLLDNEGTDIPTIAVVQDGQRSILTTNEGATQQELRLFSSKSSFGSLIKNVTQAALPTLRNHQAAIVDFSGDCRSDLVMLSENSVTNQQYLQFFELDTDGTYTMPENVTLRNRISRMNFADISTPLIHVDFDGALDMVAIVNLSSSYVLEVYYNNNPNTDALCQGNQLFSYDFSQENIQRIVLPHKLTNSSMLSLGDANSDGYPDLLTTLLDDSNNTKAYLLLNQACTSGDKNCDLDSETSANIYGQLRTFKYDEIANPIRDASQSVVSASFTDIAFAGQLDIIINVFNVGNGSYSLAGIINNLKEDAFFIKALPLTSFSSEDDSRLVNSFGVTFQWKITTLEGNSVNSVAGQLIQQTNRALQLPFVCVGLGRTNNYLEDFTVVYTGDGNNQSWTPVIPNSQLLVIPSGTDKEWTLGIYISSTEKIKQVVIITAIILILIGMLIVWLIRKENEEDRRNQFMFFQLIR